MPEKKTEEKDERGFYARLIDAMKDMENPTKSKQAYKYKYETLEQVLGIIRPALANNGLMLTQKLNRAIDDDTWILQTIVFDSSGKEVIMDTRPMTIANDAQAQGSWETYLRRYALRTAFGLTGEDDDGEATKGKPKQNKAAQTKSKPTVTEMASDQLMANINDKVNELSELRGKEPAEVVNGLMKLKLMEGAKFNNLTKDQATSALNQLIVWIDKAQPVEPELYDEDQEF